MKIVRASFQMLMVSSLLSGGAALVLMSVAPLFDEGGKSMVDISKDACPNKIEGYRNSVNWYRGPNRIIVRAKTACASKYGEEFELTDVTIEIRSGQKVITQAHANDGAFWPARNEMLIGKSDMAANLSSCVPEFPVMQIDMKTGEMRTPGMQAFLNSKDEIVCSLKRRSHG